MNFLSLERTARHYADMMDVWLRLRDLGGFEWIENVEVSCGSAAACNDFRDFAFRIDDQDRAPRQPGV